MNATTTENMSEINTPRTAAQRRLCDHMDYYSESFGAMADHAELLERELIQAQQTIAQLREQREESSQGIDADIYFTAKVDAYMRNAGFELPETEADEDDSNEPHEALCKSIIFQINSLEQTIAQKDGEIRVLRGSLEIVQFLGETGCLQDSLDEAKRIAKEALSTPAPVAVVPWEVVEAFVLASENMHQMMNFDIAYPIQQRDGALELYQEGKDCLQSYAPKKGNQ